MKKLIIALMLSLMMAGSALASQSSFTWLPNVEEDLAGYTLHYGSATGDYTGSLDCVLPVTVEGRVPCTLNYESNGLTYFAVTAYDTGGNHSAYSSELSFDPAPAAPQGIKINVTVTVEVGL